MDCIDKILNYYKKKDDQKEQEIKIKIGKILIELMEELKEPESKRNYIIVKNCLILLINLFLDVESVDRFHLQGKDRDDLSKEETILLSELLKSEINNYQEEN